MNPRQVIQEFYKLIKDDIENYITLLPMIIADNKDDENIMRLSIDMIKSLKHDLEHAESLSELSDTLDVDAILDDWEELQKKLMRNGSMNSHIIRDAIQDEFMVHEE